MLSGSRFMRQLSKTHGTSYTFPVRLSLTVKLLLAPAESVGRPMFATGIVRDEDEETRSIVGQVKDSEGSILCIYRRHYGSTGLKLRPAEKAENHWGILQSHVIPVALPEVLLLHCNHHRLSTCPSSSGLDCNA